MTSFVTLASPPSAKINDRIHNHVTKLKNHIPLSCERHKCIAPK